MAGNSLLDDFAATHMNAARALTAHFDKSTTLFGEASYQTGSWTRERRVVFEAEVVHAEGNTPRDNARFSITDLPHGPEHVWRNDCERGDCENRIKELENDLEIDRTSCTSFVPDQVRVLLTATAYVLHQELRFALRGTELARGMVATLRLRLLETGATVTESVRRIGFPMPRCHPWKHLWMTAASRIAAFT